MVVFFFLGKNQESRIESSPKPGPQGVSNQFLGAETGGSSGRFLKIKCWELRTQVLLKSWNKPDSTGCNNSTRAIEHFGQILGKLTFKCRQLQGPILCRFLHLTFVRVSAQRKARTTQVGPQARGSHVLWRAEQGTKRRTPNHISPESRPVLSRVFDLNTPRFRLPV